MAKLPAFQFYPGDWRKDPGVQSLSFHDRGVWFEIICLMHESDVRGKLVLNGRAMPQDALARLLGIDEHSLGKTIDNLLNYGVASLDPETAALTNRRMVKDEQMRKAQAEGGVRGGSFGHLGKEFGRLGGRPSNNKQKDTEEKRESDGKITPLEGFDKPPSKPPSSSSSSTSVNKKERSPSVMERKFIQPTLEQVTEYCQQRNKGVDAERWFAYYTSNGWRVGKNPMKDWKAAVITWEKGAGNGAHQQKPRFESTQEKNARRVQEYLGSRKTGNYPEADSGILSLLPEGAAGDGRAVGN